MHHAHDASTERAPRARAVAVPHVHNGFTATSVEVALLFVLLALLALLL